jgi:hypothetical protein
MASSQLSMFSAVNPTVVPAPEVRYLETLRYESVSMPCGHKVMDAHTGGGEVAFLNSAWTREQVDAVVDMLNWAEARSHAERGKVSSWRR